MVRGRGEMRARRILISLLRGSVLVHDAQILPPQYCFDAKRSQSLGSIVALARALGSFSLGHQSLREKGL